MQYKRRNEMNKLEKDEPCMSGVVLTIHIAVALIIYAALAIYLAIYWAN